MIRAAHQASSEQLTRRVQSSLPGEFRAAYQASSEELPDEFRTAYQASSEQLARRVQSSLPGEFRAAYQASSEELTRLDSSGDERLSSCTSTCTSRAPAGVAVVPVRRETFV